ncbi:hypothetical protein NUW58_g4004 [Xylaria curta]|uniref:Uncharacterized protein n=1 Tax=Xylaria curta TaxID=42375 RepID=A0ACC1P8A7_9PEZI|nr:hypothetical protein NUW58_g4004 [Xylaria curta]
MWDQCLRVIKSYRAGESAGRNTSRFSLPSNVSDHNEENWTPTFSSWKDLGSAEVGNDEGEADSEDIDSEDSYDEMSLEERLEEKWKEVRQPVIPDPIPFEEVDYSPPHRLSRRFKDSGLQIIVKMVSIELTPEKPSYPAGSWHVEGQMNEHICATALYYLDSENITTSDLSFRMQTNSYLSDEAEYRVRQDAYHWLEETHGTRLGVGARGVCLQNYGSVETPQGRFLAFPNVFQHRVSPFQLVDPTKPGHRRFIALWLVDPHIRIISTANVPPQQQHWWVESVFGRSVESQQASLARLPADLTQLLGEQGWIDEGHLSRPQGKLPPEPLNIVRMHLGEAPTMSDGDARDHRLKLMDERTTFHDTVDQAWLGHSYNFCEH